MFNIYLIPLIALGTTHVLGEPRKHNMAVLFQLIGGGAFPQVAVP